MSDSAGPSSSRVAMSIAFKRARRRFPKNFGVNSNITDETYQSSESEDISVDSKPTHEPSTNSKLIEEIVSDQIDSLLADALDVVEICDSTEVLCNQCENAPNYSESIGQEEVLISDDKEKNEYDYDPQLSFSDLNIPKNNHNFSPRITQQNCTTNEIDQSLDIIWTKEDNTLYENSDKMTKREVSFIETEWNPTEKLTNAMYTEIDTGMIYENSSKYHEQPDTSSRQKKHRCKKQSLRSCHSCTHFVALDCACEDNRLLHSPNCPHYKHCAHCHHWYRRCCCSNYCCCNRCCFNWQDQHCSSTHAQESRSPTRRRSSGHRKSKRCAACRRGQTSPTTSSRRGDVCSRDSGIFTNVYYENEDYVEDEGVSCNTLMHKDSLSILQEKYSTSGRKRNERKLKERLVEDKYRSGKYDASENDDEVYRNSDSHKSCRRLCRRYSNSY